VFIRILILGQAVHWALLLLFELWLGSSLVGFLPPCDYEDGSGFGARWRRSRFH